MTSNLRLALRDFLSFKFIALSILPLLASLVAIATLIAYSNTDEIIYSRLANMDLRIFGFDFNQILEKLISSDITQILVKLIFWAIEVLVVGAASIALALIITGLFTPIIVNEINKRHYRIAIAPISSMRALWLMVGTGIKFVLLFAVCLMLMFIPVLNLFILHLPLFYLYYSFMFIDVGSNTLPAWRFWALYPSRGGGKFKFSAFIFYLLCLIPFVGLFLQIFFVIYFAHFFLQKSKPA